MKEKKYDFKRIGTNEIEMIKELFISVFTIEPWNDDCFLQTEKTVPAYGFYQKNGFYELKEHVSFVKQI